MRRRSNTHEVLQSRIVDFAARGARNLHDFAQGEARRRHLICVGELADASLERGLRLLLVRDGDFLSKIKTGDRADGEQLLFDLVQPQAISGDLGETFGAAGQVEEALRVQPTEVAGFEAPFISSPLPRSALDMA